jgi:hypothetical protein
MSMTGMEDAGSQNAGSRLSLAARKFNSNCSAGVSLFAPTGFTGTDIARPEADFTE